MMPAALETKDKGKADRNIELYLSCDAFVGVSLKSSNYKIYPRVKDRDIFFRCVKEKHGELNEEWVKTDIGNKNAKK